MSWWVKKTLQLSENCALAIGFLPKLTETKFDNITIIRAGYGKETTQKDSYFEMNYSGATGAGISIGAYHYSYAKTVADAEKEAEICMGWLSGKYFNYPIYYDIEENSQAALGKATCTAMARAFCEKIKAAGYKPGVYANKNFFTNYLDKPALQATGYSLWIAHYGTGTDYSSQYDIHQYSSTGSVNGISGSVDMNYVFKEFSCSSSGGSTSAKKSNEEIANEVIAGKWGRGTDRKNKLTAAGYNYSAIQALVNQKLGAKPAPKPPVSLPKYVVGRTYTTQVDNLNVRTGSGVKYAKKSKPQLTADGQKKSNNAGQLKKGTVVTCKAVQTVGKDVWIKTPSGWLAAYYGGKYYVK